MLQVTVWDKGKGGHFLHLGPCKSVNSPGYDASNLPQECTDWNLDGFDSFMQDKWLLLSCLNKYFASFCALA